MDKDRGVILEMGKDRVVTVMDKDRQTIMDMGKFKAEIMVIPETKIDEC